MILSSVAMLQAPSLKRVGERVGEEEHRLSTRAKERNNDEVETEGATSSHEAVYLRAQGWRICGAVSGAWEESMELFCPSEGFLEGTGLDMDLEGEKQGMNT